MAGELGDTFRMMQFANIRRSNASEQKDGVQAASRLEIT